MKILIGTTNKSKLKRFEEILSFCNFELYTLGDLGITDEPQETGSTPEENVAIKAEFYGKYFDTVICNDSGLYFDGLPLDDSRQPGLHIRSPQEIRLDDEQMIEYYSKLISELGGKIKAYYLDGFAVYKRGIISTFTDIEQSKSNYFYMVSEPSPLRHIGWPLDSISIDRNTGLYFVDRTQNDENIIVDNYQKMLIEFYKNAVTIQHPTPKT